MAKPIKVTRWVAFNDYGGKLKVEKLEGMVTAKSFRVRSGTVGTGHRTQLAPDFGADSEIEALRKYKQGYLHTLDRLEREIALTRERLNEVDAQIATTREKDWSDNEL